ncbi:MAG TPA: amidohydrolase family protein [Pirellulales bacterium]|nr:amidohydrolase family protein [Pirellulales bacterium]
MRRALRGCYVFPITSPPIADGVVTIDEGRIVGVGREPALAGCHLSDLGNVAILPGLVNAHTHLEFSGLAAPLGVPGTLLPDWIRLVVAYRRALPPDSQAAAVEQGVKECRAHGVVAVGEIATTDFGDAVANTLTDATVFREIIGLKRELIDERLAAARQFLAVTTSRPHREGEGKLAARPPARDIRRGISPHAPYSVHPELFDRLIDLASGAQAPVAFHLAETREELDLLATGRGPFRELLVELGAWDETAIPRGTRPIDYLRRLADRGVHGLVIHGNYLDDEETQFIGAHAERLTVVYCPRTHAYFGHARHPLPRLLAAGANVALGTDSRASNPDLNLLEEIRLVARQFPELPPATALELGTLRAARALGIDDRFGSLERGKLAAIVTVRLPETDAAEPHQLIYESDCTAEMITHVVAEEMGEKT